MTVDATLASIDGALEDWGTSGDAMRWQPDPDRVICDDRPPLLLARRPRCRCPLVPFEHAIAIEVCKLFGVPLIIGSHSSPRPARCRACNPAGNPRPLAIDGAAYRRKQRNRRRR